MSQGRLRVLVVIPCLDEAGTIVAILKQFMHECPGQLIAVADGGSSDGTRELVRAMACWHEQVKLVDNPDRIQSAGINRAVELHGNDREWLLRIDAHCDYPPGFARVLLNAAQDRAADSVVVPMHTVARSGFAVAAALAQNSVLGTGGASHRVAGPGKFVEHGHHALMRLAAFRAAGGYCEAMTCNEDAELDIRLKAGGTRIWLEPAACVEYHPRGSPAALARQYFRYGIGRATTVLRHRKAMRLRQIAPLAVAPAAVLAAATPFYPLAAVPAAAWAMLCQVWGIGLGIGARRPAGLLAGTAAMIMHLAWSSGFWSRAVIALLQRVRPSHCQPAEASRTVGQARAG